MNKITEFLEQQSWAQKLAMQTKGIFNFRGYGVLGVSSLIAVGVDLASSFSSALWFVAAIGGFGVFVVLLQLFRGQEDDPKNDTLRDLLLLFAGIFVTAFCLLMFAIFAGQSNDSSRIRSILGDTQSMRKNVQQVHLIAEAKKVADQIGVQKKAGKPGGHLLRFELLWPKSFDLEDADCEFLDDHLPKKHIFEIQALNCAEVEVTINTSLFKDPSVTTQPLTAFSHIPFPKLNVVNDDKSLELDIGVLLSATAQAVSLWVSERIRLRYAEQHSEGDQQPEVPTTSDLNVIPQVSGFVNELVLFIKMSDNFRASSFEFLYSLEIDSELIPLEGTFRARLPFPGKDEFFLWLRGKKGNDNLIGPFVQSGLFEKAIKHDHVGDIRAPENRWHNVRCKGASCEIEKQCYSVPVSVYLKNAAGDFVRAFTFPTCDGYEQQYGSNRSEENLLCEGGAWRDFNFTVGQHVDGEIRYPTGVPTEFKVEVEPRYSGNEIAFTAHSPEVDTALSSDYEPVPRVDHYIEHRNIGDSPGISARVSLDYDTINTSITYNVCNSNSQFMLDVDGKGLVEENDNIGGEGYLSFASKVPENDSFRFAVDSGKNTREGPFEVQYDLINLIKLQALVSEEPKIECRGRNCKSENQHAWYEIDAIQYRGSHADDYQLLKIDLTPERVLQELREGKHISSSSSSKILAVDLKVPEEWESLYYKIHYKDGTISNEIRLVL